MRATSRARFAADSSSCESGLAVPISASTDAGRAWMRRRYRDHRRGGYRGEGRAKAGAQAARGERAGRGHRAARDERVDDVEGRAVEPEDEGPVTHHVSRA